MRHISTFIRTNLRGIPTETLKGNAIPEKSREVNGTKQVIRPGVPGWDTGAWSGEAKREVEHELARRNKARNRRQKRQAVIPSDAGQNSDGTV